MTAPLTDFLRAHPTLPPDAQVETVSEANNTVYRLALASAPDAPLGVVRVHRPAPHKTQRWVESELRVLGALHAAGLPVPQPLPPVMTLPDDDGAPRIISALGWLGGRAKPVTDWVALDAHHAGGLLGRLHHALRPIPLTPQLDRPVLDAASVFGGNTQYALDVEGEALLAPYADLFERVRQRAENAFALFEAAGLAAQPIHGDYKPDNLLWDGLAPQVIDFDDCALGNPAYDLATLWLFLRANTRAYPLQVYSYRAWCSALDLDESPQAFAAVQHLMQARIALSCRWVAGNRANPSLAGRAAGVIAERLMALRADLDR
ncbi:MAG: aminoglycoside phosphotransferase family protein, partial [Anaerolineae bacterium]|nr:aminoglycoside phosphotransferase family protein [Anaerolineae bacterium]